MDALRLELFETDAGNYTVIAGARFSANLGRDEALGVVASLLFGSNHLPPFMKDYAGWTAWQMRYAYDKPVAPAALLTWNGRAQ